MAIEYSFLADWLNKFHTSTPFIQALWLVALASVPFSLCWCLRGMALAFAPKRRTEPIGQTLYSVAQMEDGALRVFRHVPDLAEINREALALLAKPEGRDEPVAMAKTGEAM
jgi:hypothetical protein